MTLLWNLVWCIAENHVHSLRMCVLQIKRYCVHDFGLSWRIHPETTTVVGVFICRFSPSAGDHISQELYRLS